MIAGRYAALTDPRVRRLVELAELDALDQADPAAAAELVNTAVLVAEATLPREPNAAGRLRRLAADLAGLGAP